MCLLFYKGFRLRLLFVDAAAKTGCLLGYPFYRALAESNTSAVQVSNSFFKYLFCSYASVWLGRNSLVETVNY